MKAKIQAIPEANFKMEVLSRGREGEKETERERERASEGGREGGRGEGESRTSHPSTSEFIHQSKAEHSTANGASNTDSVAEKDSVVAGPREVAEAAKAPLGPQQ